MRNAAAFTAAFAAARSASVRTKTADRYWRDHGASVGVCCWKNSNTSRSYEITFGS